MDKYDAIIIGGGLGGLTAGAKLSKEGKRVLLIEQHIVPGGCATTFNRKDFVMEVGLHEMDGLDKHDRKTKIFKDLGVFDNVELIRVPEFYRFNNQRVDIVIPDNTKKAIEILTEEFPKEEQGIKKFFRKIQGTRKEIFRLPRENWKVILLMPIFPLLFPNIFLNQKRTLGDLLDKLIKNEDLKLVLEANIGYYHDDPYTMSLLYFSVAQAGYYSGGYYIKGGSQKLSDYLAKIIKDNGGRVLLGNLVTKILTENNKAIGVEYKKSLRRDKKLQKVFAKTIIANAAIPNVANELLAPNISRELKTKIKDLEESCSLLTIYFGFSKPVKELGNRNYSTFIIPEDIKKQSDWIKNYHNSFENRGFVFVDYSQIDSGLSSEDKCVGEICTVDYLSNWDNLSKEQYKDKKEKVAQIFIEKLNEVIPGIKNEIEYYEVGTPKTIKRYTLNPNGAVYGFAQIPKQAGMNRITNKSPINNLYFSSAWTMPGGGFTGAILGGYFCALDVLKKGL